MTVIDQTPPTKSTVILAQVFISCLMALLMSGIFTAIPTALAPGWVGIWLSRFATAWPIAFVLSMAVGPVSFWLARRTQHLLAMARGQRR